MLITTCRWMKLSDVLWPSTCWRHILLTVPTKIGLSLNKYREKKSQFATTSKSKFHLLKKNHRVGRTSGCQRKPNWKVYVTSWLMHSILVTHDPLDHCMWTPNCFRYDFQGPIHYVIFIFPIHLQHLYFHHPKSLNQNTFNNCSYLFKIPSGAGICPCQL